MFAKLIYLKIQRFSVSFGLVNPKKKFKKTFTGYNICDATYNNVHEANFGLVLCFGETAAPIIPPAGPNKPNVLLKFLLQYQRYK